MPQNWKTYRIEEIASDVAMGPFGSNLKRDNFIETGVPIIRGGNLTTGWIKEGEFVYVSDDKADSLGRSVGYPDDLVFTHRGTIGQVGIIPRNEFPRYVVSQSQMRLTVNNKIADPRFLFYFFISPIGQYRWLMNSSQVGVPAIAQPTRSLKNVEVALPELKEQKAIASILSALDDKIELNLKMNKTLEEMAMALYKHWFVDFGPFQDGEFVDSGLGLIPKGWEVKRISEFALPKKGKNITKKNVIPGEFPVVAGGLQPSVYHNQSNTKFPVITISASGANAGFVKLYHNSVWSSDSSYLDNTITHWVYTVYLFLKKNQKTIFEMQEGSAQPHIYPRHIGSLKFCLSSGLILTEFEKLVTPHFLKIKNTIAENQTLTKLRDTLLPKLISGEVRVKDVEKTIAEAL